MNFIPALKKLIGQNRVQESPAVLKKHSTDAWLFSHQPDAVVFARNSDDVSRVMRFATAHHVPITVRGAGVGYVGGCVPAKGGIVLSLAKMNRIKEINIDDGVVVAQPGVITADIQEAVKKKNFFYPPDPASLKESSIGGNIATNAGGPRCLKYGVTRHYVLGLEVVLPTGEIIKVGSRTHKNKTGFDLVGLFVGSEGLLGTVTEVTLRVIPHPPVRACISVGFKNEKHAAKAVQAVLRSGHIPSALEITDRFTLQAVRNRFPKTIRSPFNIPKGDSHLLIEIDGRLNSVKSELRELEKLMRKLKCLTVERAVGDKACERIWNLRREFSRSLKATGLLKLNEDITIPRSYLPQLFDFTKQLQRKHGIAVAAFGHAGDGNIHVNLMVDSTSKTQMRISEVALDELFTTVLSWGGVITGEHGIGLAKKRWWPMAVSSEVRKLHVALKKTLDPAGILNPGKFVE